ncbi:MAG: DMT family transporter [Anaerolineae bacterium]|nr:DMT family transporter [Anaerolineae bacterium]
MFKNIKISPQLLAIVQAIFVTILWSTSWVLIKFGLEDIPALTFAGLRYTLAFLLLLPVYLRKSTSIISLHSLTRRDWTGLVVLGLLYYTITQGSQFLGLVYLPAITFSLLLNFTAPIVALLGLYFLKERLTAVQWLGVGVFLTGVAVYFYPVLIPPGLALGFTIAAVNILAASASSVLGRYINRTARIDALTVTVVSMGIGAILLLAVGIAVEGFPSLDIKAWLLVFWLAVVNTALAFTLWNHTLRTLSAAQSSIINNTMLVQIAILAWLFLGERPDAKAWLGMAIVAVGAVLVNLPAGEKK